MSELELTDKQKAECQKIMDNMSQYFWSRIKLKMESISFEEALKEVQEEMMNE